ncbi:MAG: hypothetical protein AAFO15_01080 [Pseudomonadota bacterium]
MMYRLVLSLFVIMNCIVSSSATMGARAKSGYRFGNRDIEKVYVIGNKVDVHFVEKTGEDDRDMVVSAEDRDDYFVSYNRKNKSMTVRCRSTDDNFNLPRVVLRGITNKKIYIDTNDFKGEYEYGANIRIDDLYNSVVRANDAKVVFNDQQSGIYTARDGSTMHTNRCAWKGVDIILDKGSISGKFQERDDARLYVYKGDIHIRVASDCSKVKAAVIKNRNQSNKDLNVDGKLQQLYTTYDLLDAGRYSSGYDIFHNTLIKNFNERIYLVNKNIKPAYRDNEITCIVYKGKINLKHVSS